MASPDSQSAAAVQDGPAPARRGWWLPACFLIVIGIGFANALGFDFVNWDDDQHVLLNPAVVGTGSAHDSWLTPSLGYVIPVTVASYRLEYRLVGGAPWLYHADNLLLHLGVCGLLYAVGRRIGLGRRGAAFAMLIFGLHPVVAEPVAWVSGRKDLLAALGALLATWAFLRASASPARRVWFALLSTVAFTLAAFSKPSVLALPFAWFWLGPKSPGRTRWLALPAILVTLLASALSLVGQNRIGAFTTSLPAFVWLREVWYSLGYHAGLALFIQQALAKHIPLHMPPAFDPAVDLLPVGLALLAWIYLRARKDDRAVASALIFAALAYLPCSGLAPLKRYLADTYVYLPLVGLAWVAGTGVESLAPRLHRRWQWALGIAAVFVLLVGARGASSRWKNGIALWTSVYERYPDSPQVCLNLGNAHFESGNVKLALDLYDRCSRQFGPDHFAKNRAIALFIVGRVAEAKTELIKLAAQSPDPVIRKYLGYIDAAAVTTAGH